MELPIIENHFAADRVMVESDGLSVPHKEARDVFKITPDIIFLRNDGWTLGAPKIFERIAFKMWAGDWTHFVRTPHTQWVEIERYIK